MSNEVDSRPQASTGASDDEPIPFMQRLLDNPFVLLIIGIAMPTIFYLIWGIIEITQIPVAP